MAVCMISSYKNFAGASTDEKPENVAEGSTFHAVDTGEEYVRHNGMWVQDLRRINAIKLAVA